MTRWVAIVGLLVLSCGSDGGSDASAPSTSVFAAPRCADGAAAPIALRDQDATSVVVGSCGEVAYTGDDDHKLHLVPVGTGQPFLVGEVAAYAFTSNSDRLVTIDDAGKVVTVIDTTTLETSRVTVDAPPSPTAIGVLGDLDHADQAIYVCGSGRLRIHALSDGHSMADRPFTRECSAVVGGPRGSAIGFIDETASPPTFELLRFDGQVASVPFDLPNDPGNPIQANGVSILNDGRFLGATGRIAVAGTGDTGGNRLRTTVVDTRTLAVRGHVESAVIETDAGTVTSTDSGISLIAIDGSTRPLANDGVAFAAFEGPSGWVVLSRPVESVVMNLVNDVRAIDVTTGATLFVIPTVQDLIVSRSGKTFAYTRPAECGLSAPCVSFLVRHDGVERMLGWTPPPGFGGLGPGFVDDDGTVIGPGDLQAGAVPPHAEPRTDPLGAVFVAHLDGSIVSVPPPDSDHTDPWSVHDADGVALVARWLPGPDTQRTELYAMSDGGLRLLTGTLPYQGFNHDFPTKTRRRAFGVLFYSGLKSYSGALYTGALR